MTTATEIESLRFHVDEPKYVEAGAEYRTHTRFYESGIVGTVHLYLNDTELVVGNRLPAKFELSDSVAILQHMVSQLQTSDYAETTPFCCVCGDRGCTYIRWKLEQAEDVVLLTMEDFSDEPLGDHQYLIQPELLKEAVTELTDIVIRTLRKAGVEETSAGSIHKFEQWKQQ